MDFFEPIAHEFEDDLKELRVRLVGGLLFLIAVTAVGTLGFKVIDPSAGWIRAFFMTAITLTTVGYGEEVPVDTDGARIFTAVLILVGMGGVLYFVSTGTAFILEGQLSHVFRRRRMAKDLASISGHLIVCGAGKTAVYTALELIAVKRAVVMVTDLADHVPNLREALPDVPIVLGDATHDDVLLAAGVKRAAGLIVCTDVDNSSVVVTLTARHLNPDLRIVSRMGDVKSESKIRKVGADAVVSPAHIGGLRLASEMIRPNVVSFLDAMLRDRTLNLRIDELTLPPGSSAVGKSIAQLDLARVPSALLLATRRSADDWTYNPPSTHVVVAGTALIFLATPEDSRALCDQLEGEMIAGPSLPD